MLSLLSPAPSLSSAHKKQEQPSSTVTGRLGASIIECSAGEVAKEGQAANPIEE